MGVGGDQFKQGHAVCVYLSASPCSCLPFVLYPIVTSQSSTEQQLGPVVLSKCYHGSGLPCLNLSLDTVYMFGGLAWLPVCVFLPVIAERHFPADQSQKERDGRAYKESQPLMRSWPSVRTNEGRCNFISFLVRIVENRGHSA